MDQRIGKLKQDDRKMVELWEKFRMKKHLIRMDSWQDVTTLRQSGKLKELTHKMERYNWQLLGPCEHRWKNSGEVYIEGHTLYFS